MDSSRKVKLFLLCSVGLHLAFPRTPAWARFPQRYQAGRPALASSEHGDTNSQSVVDRLLEEIKDTNRGILASADKRASIMDLILKLEAAGNGKDFFDDGTAYGNYEVAYVGASSSRIANLAGGRWRGRFGRLAFPTRGLYQHLLPSEEKTGDADAIAVNLVQVAMFGLLPIRVMLYGLASRLDATDRKRVTEERETPGGLSMNSVRAKFQSPRIALGSCWKGPLGFVKNFLPLRFAVGPESSVVLDAPYVDERIRIGKGASGIYFVFTRTGSENANAWQQILRGPALGAKAFGTILAVAGLCGLLRCRPNHRGVGLPGSILLIIAGALFWRSSGGIVRRQPKKADYPGQGLSSADQPA